ncbi:hypothetical protein Lal_00042506 [Lupinus albus]|nr:hypothetical protein Lal_00042506 [Lupinus albus]
MIDNFISFSDQEVPIEGRGLGDAILGPSSTVVKAFDGARRDVVGEIELPIKIGPCIFKVLFQVMDINPRSAAYWKTMDTLGWCHTVVASRKSSGRLITVMGEEDTLVSQLSDAPYVEADSEALEASFRALEIANASSIEKDTQCLILCHPMHQS